MCFNVNMELFYVFSGQTTQSTYVDGSKSTSAAAATSPPTSDREGTSKFDH